MRAGLLGTGRMPWGIPIEWQVCRRENRPWESVRDLDRNCHVLRGQFPPSRYDSGSIVRRIGRRLVHRWRGSVRFRCGIPASTRRPARFVRGHPRLLGFLHSNGARKVGFLSPSQGRGARSQLMAFSLVPNTSTARAAIPAKSSISVFADTCRVHVESISMRSTPSMDWNMPSFAIAVWAEPSISTNANRRGSAVSRSLITLTRWTFPYWDRGFRQLFRRGLEAQVPHKYRSHSVPNASHPKYTADPPPCSFGTGRIQRPAVGSNRVY